MHGRQHWLRSLHHQGRKVLNRASDTSVGADWRASRVQRRTHANRGGRQSNLNGGQACSEPSNHSATGSWPGSFRRLKRPRSNVGYRSAASRPITACTGSAAPVSPARGATTPADRVSTHGGNDAAKDRVDRRPHADAAGTAGRCGRPDRLPLGALQHQPLQEEKVLLDQGLPRLLLLPDLHFVLTLARRKTRDGLTSSSPPPV